MSRIAKAKPEPALSQFTDCKAQLAETKSSMRRLLDLLDGKGEQLDDAKRQFAAAESEANSQREDKELATETLTREYHYHMLRAEELKQFLRGFGITFGE